MLTGGTLYGIIGALLALPLAAALLMVIEEMRLELPGESKDIAAVLQDVKDARVEAEYVRRTEGLPVDQAAAIAVEISDTRKEQENPRQEKAAE